MFQRYNIRDYVTSMTIQKTNPEYCKIERKRFGNFRHELKSTVIKSHFFDGYFDGAGLSEEDYNYIVNGHSPVRMGSNGNEYMLFTIHHIKPLNCGGETRPSNLIPLPRTFHTFIHEKVFDPQLAKIKVGETAEIVGVPDFSKISLNMMNDPSFRIQYHKFMVDEYKVYPIRLMHHKTKRARADSFNQWYQKTFENIK